MTRSRHVTRVTALVAAGCALTASLLAGSVTGETTADAAPVARAGTAEDGSYRETQTISRSVLDAQGNEDPTYSRSYEMTVTADKTTDLRGRERMKISWSGAPSSAARAANPFGEDGIQQEYPVVVLQCRGRDDASLPLDQQVAPETCFTTSVIQRSQVQRSASEALWTVDRFNSAAQRQRYIGPANPKGAGCASDYTTSTRYTRLTEFRSLDGRTFTACNTTTMPPEAAVDAAFPAAEVAAYTDAQGKGSTLFEVRSDTENESLGCSDEVDCSVVVVPILGISCDVPASIPTASDRACRKNGLWQAGSNNFAQEGIDAAVGPVYWWSESNWRNRFSIPIDFGLPPDVCDILDSRAPVPIYGSELISQAALQWAPAYCLNKKRFKFQAGAMADPAAWDLMETGQAPAAFIAAEHTREGADPVGYAPTAVTGFSIGYIIDKPDNAGEYVQLKLNARLIAKMITQSYLGSDLGRAHPGMSGNWLGIMEDPEFKALNPGLSERVRADAANMMSLSISSDVIEALTSYLAQDADAMAFIGGERDPSGMVVNPAYEDIELPRTDWPLLDEFTPTTADECRQVAGGVYFTELAAPVTTLRKISDALIDAWPLAQTTCATDYTDMENPISAMKRASRQGFGARFLMGITSLGDAERFGLHSAALRNGEGAYVKPTTSSLAKTIRVGSQEGSYGPFDLDAEKVAATGGAYPGTMIVYTAARLANLEQEQATTIARFIRIAVTEGQRQGRSNGELPSGYLPITKRGSTAALYAAALRTADAIEAQGGADEDETDADSDPDADSDEENEDGGPGDDSDATPPGSTSSDPDGSTPGDPSDAGKPGDGSPADADATTTAATEAASSSWGGALLPALLVIGLLAGASSVVSWLVGSRGSAGP